MAKLFKTGASCAGSSAQNTEAFGACWLLAGIATSLLITCGGAVAATTGSDAQKPPQATPSVVPGGGSPTVNYFEQNVLIRSGETVEALGPTLMGDSINEYTGNLEFTQTDVSLPGNNGLSVAVGRHVGMGVRQVVGYQGLFGDWDLEIPRLHAVVTNTSSWYGAGNSLNRCSQMAVPPFATAYATTKSYSVSPHQYWDGYHLYVPGVGDQTMLTRGASNTTQPTDGYTYPIVTKQHWQFRCLASMERGTGEGFVARSPDGVLYQFDHMVTRTHLSFKAAVGALLQRNEVLILPTQVTDRFGNWVRYTYAGTDGMRVQSITSSDGRSITFTYNGSGNRIGSISDGTRTWSYGYDGNGALQTVTQPDGAQWTFSLFQLERDPLSSPDPDCSGDDVPWDALLKTGTVTHPSGAVGTFSLQMTMHGRSNVPGTQATCSAALASRYFTNYAVKTKQLSGPGMSTMTWTYAYGEAIGSYAPCGTGCANTKTVTVTDPKGDVTVSTFGTQFGVNDGSLLSRSEGVSGSTNLRNTTFGFRASNAGPYPASIGTNGHYADSMSVIHTPQNLRTITQQGATFTQTGTAFDTFARVSALTRSSTLGHSRTESIAFADDLTLWVLGQVATQTVAGLTAAQTSFYAATAMPYKTWKFNKPEFTFAYNADGTFATVADGLNQTTTLANYKRGLPQLVTFADGRTVSGVVNNIGTLDSVTNEAGTTWSYGYDVMGRLSRKTPPTGDAVAYNNTTLSFVQVPYAELGIPAGHWRQTISVGNAVTNNFFDARWRKIVTQTYDATNVGATQRMQRFNYDAYNRKTNATYPVRTLASYTDSLPGTSTSFDALGRPTVTNTDSELGTVTSNVQYIANFKRQETDPRGYVTTTSFQAFDEPSEVVVAAIALPEGVAIDFSRDALSKTLSITRSGTYASSPVSFTRRFVYDQFQQLCKTVDPEIGATIRSVDAANNLAWKAVGLTLTSPASCDSESVPAARKIAYTYDARNRLTGVGFGDGSASIGRAYTPDGLPLTIVSGDSTWTYAYNNRRLLTSESLGSAGSATWPVTRSYDANGNLSQLVYPDASSLTYAPNALGEPTQIGSYATNVAYHPNGAVRTYTLGNGIVHTVTQNTRGLPLVNQDVGVLNDQYAYDASGNVASITDNQLGSGGRTMTYDGLDRLRTVNAPGVWGTATYDYDPLSNVRSSIVGTSNSSLSYDSSNRLSTIVTNGAALGLSYDVQGNVNGRGSLGFYFDQGNRLQLANGVANYLYDGLGRRTGIFSNSGLSQRQMYDSAGRLLYETRQVGASAGWTRYVHLNGKLIATIDSAANTTYQHTDALGSPVASTSASGTLLARTWYEPYGKVAAGATPSGPGFTGHVNDSSTGLIYMQQRYYDPVSARFLSLDPITTNADTAANFNVYEYAQSNPYLYTDPDGRASALFQVGGSAFVGGGVEGYLGVYVSGAPKWDIGVYASGGWGYGLGGGLAASGGLMKGTADDVRGATVNSNVSSGLGSVTIMKNEYGEVVGFTAGPAAKLGASVTDSRTGVLSLRELIQKWRSNAEKEKAPAGDSPPAPSPSPKPKTPGTSSDTADSSTKKSSDVGFKGVFRVEGRIESKKLDKVLRE